LPFAVSAKLFHESESNGIEATTKITDMWFKSNWRGDTRQLMGWYS
jgi:hypothetical protein